MPTHLVKETLDIAKLSRVGWVLPGFVGFFFIESLLPLKIGMN